MKGVLPLKHAAAAFRRSASPASAALRTVLALVSNIAAHPSEAKYRTLLKSNGALQQRVLRFYGAADLLHELGFTESASAFAIADGVTVSDEQMQVLRDEIETAETSERLERERNERNVRENQERIAAEAAAVAAREAEIEARVRADQAESHERKAQVASRPHDLQFGTHVNTFKDLGVDLNAKRG